MASVDNHGYVKHAMVGLLIVTVVPSATLAESKFLSLRKVIPHFLYRGILLLRGQTRCDQGLHKNPRRNGTRCPSDVPTTNTFLVIAGAGCLTCGGVEECGGYCHHRRSWITWAAHEHALQFYGIGKSSIVHLITKAGLTRKSGLRRWFNALAVHRISTSTCRFWMVSKSLGPLERSSGCAHVRDAFDRRPLA